MINNQGWINLYKPKNITSFQALKIIKKKFNFNKLGHAGTLDPIAEGILPIAIGKATKLIEYINQDFKKYIFTIDWGAQTTTDDNTGEIIKKSNLIPSKKDIESNIANFIGDLEQKPPKVSSVKINGTRAYKLVREKIDFKTKPKKVFVKELKLNSITSQTATFEIECGKGFYVRSLARDFAIKLGTFGHISGLKRTKVGNFVTSSSILLDDLVKIGNTQELINCVIPSISVLDDILAYEIDNEEDINNLSLGRTINLDKFNSKYSFKKNKLIFLSNNGDIISIGKLVGNLFIPNKILI